jgi:hypothetical protein
MCLPLGERAFLIVSHEATVPSNIGCKNGREPSRYALAGQGTSPVSVEGRFKLSVNHGSTVARATATRMRIADEVRLGGANPERLPCAPMSPRAGCGIIALARLGACAGMAFMALRDASWHGGHAIRVTSFVWGPGGGCPALAHFLTHYIWAGLAPADRAKLAWRTYSMTSSARTSRAVGTERPSARAVFRLMISSTLVVCWTGRSAGFSPLRMRPV